LSSHFLVMKMPALPTALRRFWGASALLVGLLAQPVAAQTTLAPADSVLTAEPAPAPEPVIATEAAPAPEATVAAAPVAATPDTVTVAELRKLDEQWADANVRNDAETMSQLMAPEYVSINSKGQVQQRPDMLRAIANGRAKTIVNKGFDYTIRVYGDVGVVMHNTSFMGSLNGQDTSGEYRSTHLYVRRDGRWQLTSSQTTSVASSDPRTTSLSARR
jgi:uncharacterized protein (TIGR02246 family)